MPTDVPEAPPPLAPPAGEPAAARPRPHWLRSVLDFFPRGNTLDEHVFRKRHDFLSLILALHLPALFVFGVWRGYDAGSTALELAIPLVLLIAGRVVRHRRLEAFCVTGGLVYCSSALVHLSGGTIEAHFHFFVLIGLIALYQDWVPFAWNFAFTTLSHGIASAIDPNVVFNHHAAQQKPWLWGAIHGVSVAVACVGVTIFWRSTEREQQRARELTRELGAAELAAAQSAAAQRESISELFINLARRNQTLLNRQLELIADLEQRERRPEELGELFKLDHLATRIRRNAESLLVLSGDDPPRRWGRPVPLGDVVRAAAAEVEDYKRVEVLVSDHLEVVGRAVADLAHMLAELIENATTFSPPGSEVRVRSHLSPGENSNYVLSIEDVGIGMSDADLIAANDLLADPPDIDPRRSRLGFHVVARLALRYGLRVTLASTPGGGVTAMVMLPLDLVTERRPAISVGSGAPPAGLNVYALPEAAVPAPSASPMAPDALAARDLGVEPGWPAAPAGPPGPGPAGPAGPVLDPAPADRWQSPPPIPPRHDLTGEGPAIPRETWEIAPSDAPSRPMIPTSWQSPPPIAPREPDVPADTPIVEARSTPVTPPSGEELATPPPVTDPSDALLRGRPRFRPSPDRWGPAPPEDAAPSDTDEAVADADSVVEDEAEPQPETEAPAAVVATDADAEAEAPSEVDAPAGAEPPVDVGGTDEAAETGEAPEDVATAAEGEPAGDAPADADVVEAEVVEAEVVEPEVVEDQPDAAVVDDEPVDAEIVQDEPAAAPEPEPVAPAAATPTPAPPQPAEPADFAPVPPPPPFVVMPPVPSPPIEHSPVPEVPAASMAPPPPPIPPAPVVPPPPPTPFEVAPSDEVARPFVDFGQLPEPRFDRPSYTGWPPTLRTSGGDPSAVPAFLSQPPQPPQPTPGAGDGAGAPPTPAVTADGLVKRVPGARLAAGLQSRRSGNGAPTATQFDPPLPDARRQHSSSMLSRFQAMQRDGRAAAEAADDPPDPEETS